jgi:uncharacterized protein YwqG
MIKTLLSTLLLALLFQPGQAQKRTNWENYPNKGILQYVVFMEIDNNGYNYKNAEFEPASFTSIENIELNSIKVRYNVKEDLMECKVGTQHSVIHTPKKIKEVTIQNEAYKYLQYLVKKDTTNGYLHKLTNKGIYAKYYLSASKNNSDSVKLSSYYLYQDHKQLPKKVKSPQQLISLCYKKYEKQAHKFKRVNGLNLKEVPDLQKLLAYLDDLQRDKLSPR